MQALPKRSADFVLGEHDVEALALEFRKSGRVRIRNFLADPHPLAEQLHAYRGWRQVLNAGERIYELDANTRAGMSAERAAELDHAVYAGATDGFQFRYETIRVSDDEKARAEAGDMLNQFASWLSRDKPREFLRAVTGKAGIDFADAQATRFSPGDFLTGHDDKVEGKQRIAAYVFGLTQFWRIEWGGLLIFHGADAGFTGHMPGFNVLDVFAVPIPHSVSLISPAANVKRVSVTGWLRSR